MILTSISKKHLFLFSIIYSLGVFLASMFAMGTVRHAENDSLVLWYAHNYLTSKMMAIIRI